MRWSRPRAASLLCLGACLVLLLALVAGGCALRFAEGQALEGQGRWEEAMLAYRDAVIEDPDDPEALEALGRARKVVARDNFERYQAYLAQKAFRKAYQRLLDAARQDPELAPVQDELAKWDRVLVSGQVRFAFDTSQTQITLAQEITLKVRLNTPNPGETLDAEVDIRDGTFFAEDLVYNKPPELLTLYSVNAIGVELTFGRTRFKQFTSREFQRFVNIRTPILDDLSGTLAGTNGDRLLPVHAHRRALPLVPLAVDSSVPPTNPHYSLRIEGERILVSAPKARPDFTPRFLYVNRQDRRVFVDFGRYEVNLAGSSERWSLRRLPLGGQDYFPDLSRNIALQPYFFYREGVYAYVPARSG